MKELLEQILAESRQYVNEGKLADYIPELGRVNKDRIGIFVYGENGEEYCAGDWDKRFTIQSICKPILLLMAIKDHGIEEVKKYVGVESTGKPFNAIDYSEQSSLRENINPMVNIGAIATCSMVDGENYRHKITRLLEFTSKLTGNPEIDIDYSVFASEKITGDKNKALAYLLKSAGLVTGSVTELLDVYFAMCSMKVNCKDLAHMGYLLAHHGVDINGNRVISVEEARFVNAVLTICGMYDGSGEFATKVGIPSKSGVGGGIMSVVPGKMGIGLFSPALDKKGNSVAGVKMLEKLSAELDLSIF